MGRKPTMVLVDADFFIGLYLTSDAHHQTCLSMSYKVKDELITSYDVIDEVATKLSYFRRKDLSLLFLKDLDQKGIFIIFPDASLFRSAQRFFESQKLSHVSLTDCMNMAIAKEKKVEYFLSFDAVYEKNGFKLVKRNS